MNAKKQNRTKAKGTRKRSNKNFEKKVKTVLNKFVEPSVTPSFIVDEATMTTFDTSDSSLPTIYNMIPSSLRSTSAAAITANEIALKSLKVRFLIQRPRVVNTGGSLSDANVRGRIVFARLKDSIGSPVLANFNSIYKDGQEVDSIVNSMYQNFSNFNKDMWDIKRSIPFSLNSTNEIYQPPNGLGQYKYVSLDLAKHLPKKLKYSKDPISGNLVLQNAGLYMFMLAGPSVEAPAHRRVNVNLSLTSYAEYYDL